ncbi:MAG TPA: alpha/beta hydrolase [Methylocystis sp.]|nr:alpha/beta hydrolase [Methylocystis sp.]
MRIAMPRLLKTVLMLAVVALLTFFGVRIYDSQRGSPLEPWHKFAPREMTADELDHADWRTYLDKEEEIFQSVRANVTEKLPEEDKVPYNRYYAESPVYPPSFAQDWNRSYLLAPSSDAMGAVVLLHGLTDSPYSLRHIGARYRDHGFVVVAIRAPAHGTTPAALSATDWESWLAATRLAVREARRLAPKPLPLHIVGFSNGGSLALKYALDAIENEELARPDELILISPMVGITRFARFAGLAGLPAFLPAFAKAAWLSVLPEFNPFKYNSFPVNGARQSYRLVDALQTQISRLEREGRLTALAPILTFQSVMDFTVSTQAVVSGLYSHLPANGSELVLFDVNRNAKFGPLLRPSAETSLSRLMPPEERKYRLTIITNAGEGTDDAVERVTESGSIAERRRALGLTYPKGVFSLSHVALPFPLTDSLYGLTPDSTEDFGIHLGALPLRGERGTLIVSLDALLRMSSNPFFPYLAERIEERLPAASTVEHAGAISDSANSPVRRVERRALSSEPSQRPPVPASPRSSQAPRRPR